MNEALDPLFAEIPPEVDLFDRGVSRGDTPRLWIDAVAHVAMGRDKRAYRFLHDTRVGRRVLAESHEIPDIVQAVTTYVARRMVERQRALDEDPEFIQRVAPERRRARAPPAALARVGALLFGFVLGVVGAVRRRRADRDALSLKSSRASVARLRAMVPSSARCRAIISQRHFAARAVDTENIVAGAVFAAMRPARRRRWHADRGNFLAARPVEPNKRAAMIVAVEQKFGAMLGEHAGATPRASVRRRR